MYNKLIMYYERLLTLLEKNNSYETCMYNIINPFSLYYLCNHYYGDEVKIINIPIPNDKNNLLINNNLSKIKDFDIIHCEVNYFNKFCNEILDKIEQKIILTTGQWHLPQIYKSDLTEKILNHKNVVLWISQNPIYENSSKYLAFPYGILHTNIHEYSRALIATKNLLKNKELIYLPISRDTHPCRQELPMIPLIPASQYYTNIFQGKFILSPIGDRDDCYRHYESIGLGTIPISNVGKMYKSIFTTNMIYADIHYMKKMLNKNYFNLTYTEPNRDLICFEYYKNIVETHIANIKLKYQQTE